MRKELNNTRHFFKKGVLTISRKVGSITDRVGGFFFIEAMKTYIMWSFNGFFFTGKTNNGHFVHRWIRGGWSDVTPSSRSSTVSGKNQWYGWRCSNVANIIHTTDIRNGMVSQNRQLNVFGPSGKLYRRKRPLPAQAKTNPEPCVDRCPGKCG